MSKPAKFNIVARPAKREEGSAFWSTSFFLFDSDANTGAQRFEAEGETPAHVREHVRTILAGLPLAEEFQGWSVVAQKPADVKRWPNGFKAAFERGSWIVKAEVTA